MADKTWSMLPLPALMIGPDDRMRAVNGAAEAFLGASEALIAGRAADDLFGANSRVKELIQISRQATATASDHTVDFVWPGREIEQVDLLASADEEGEVLLIIQPQSLAEHIDRTLSHRHAARSMSGMAAMLAHEIKNPLAGISGAAQLLEMGASDDDRALTELIREETQRIETLINKVEAFGDTGPLMRLPVNIHDVLDRAKRSAEAGFASHVKFREQYDPSLPEVPGDHDLMVQAVLNLMKNAAEAAPPVGGIITLRTAYRAGVSLGGARGARVSTPLLLEIADNGKGVPDDMQREIFEPFVTSKSSGSGLGLALVSKIIAEHGGSIDCQSAPGRTVFRLRFPIWQGQLPTEETAA
ncbi:MAG: ATP-binding protein [Pseudomonadota bacterium]